MSSNITAIYCKMLFSVLICHLKNVNIKKGNLVLTLVLYLTDLTDFVRYYLYQIDQINK